MKKSSLSPFSSWVLVTGATGAVGPVVVRAFYDAGYRVRALSLKPPPSGLLPEGVEHLAGDVADDRTVKSAMEGVNRVVHLAALLHQENPPHQLREEYERINVGGTAVVVDAARQAGVERVVFFSTIAVYGTSNGIILNEDSPLRPRTFYASTKLAAEDHVLSARRNDGAPLGTVLRLGAVYGARIKGNYRRLLSALEKGCFVPIGPGLNRRTLVYDKDVARAALIAAEHGSAGGRVFNVTDGRIHTLRSIIMAMCNALGRGYPVFSLPIGFARPAAALVEKGAGLAGVKPPITREAIETYTEDIAVDGARIQAELGFVPGYGLEDGWKEVVMEINKGKGLGFVARRR